MRGFKTSEFQLFEYLVSLTQNELKSYVADVLKNKYSQIVITKDYVCAVGDIPIALVAHLDTVFKKPVSNLYYDTRKNVCWSPEGLGADDRAGVYSILHILRNTKLRPHIIFTTDEEIGGIGAAVLASIPCPFEGLKYIIELDRQGTNDCVFYDLFNLEFTEYIESFGFVEDFGTFSDISYLCPMWKICGVNLSVGYKNEHSVSEILHVSALFSTINKVIKMLTVDSIPTFEYKENKRYNWMRDMWSYYPYEDSGAESGFYVHCKGCGELFSEYETFPVKGLDGRTCFYCPDCIPNNVEWCAECEEAFEIDPAHPHDEYCKDCIGGLIKCHTTLTKSNNSSIESSPTPKELTLQKQKNYSNDSSKRKKK